MRHRPDPAPPPHAAPPAADDLLSAAAAFFPDATGVEPVVGHAHLARVGTPSGAWRLRRWPTDVPEAHIQFVHAVLRRVRGAGVTLAPAVADLPSPGRGSVLALDGRHYDAQAWLPGRPAGPRAPAAPVHLPGNLPPGVFDTLLETVAGVHTATEELARSPAAPNLPLPAVAAAVQRAWADHRRRLLPVAASTPPVQRWLRVGERALPAATAALTAAIEAWPEPPVVGHHALWPAHALVSHDGTTGERLAGLIGWETAAAGSPLLDLAQLLTRFGGWSGETAETAFAVYGTVRPLAPEARRLVPAIAALDLVAEAGRLLTAAHVRGPDEPPAPTALRAAIDNLLTSLEAVSPVVAQGDNPVKAPARRWVHRPRSRHAARGSSRPPGSADGHRARPDQDPRPPRRTGSRDRG